MDTSRTSRRASHWIFQSAAIFTLAASSTLIVPSVRAQNAPATPANGGVVAPIAPAGEPIRLRTKWTPGEVLSYEMLMDGTVSMQASPNAPNNLLAGVALDIEVKATSQAALEAISVDEMGTARVVPRINALKMNASSLGQRIALTLEDGRFSFAFNGQQMGRADRNERNGAFLSNPPFALEISERGRIMGAVPLDKEGRAKAPAAQPAADAAQPAPGLDWAKLAQSMFWRAIPTLWPTTPVRAGDTWKSEVSIPLPDPATIGQVAQGEAPKLVPQQLGQFDFVLRGMEDVAGQRVARVGMKGALQLDNKTSRAIADVAKSEGAQMAPEAARRAEAAVKAAEARRKGAFDTELDKATQSIEGDLWVDPASGHVVRAELTLETQTSAHEVARPGVKAPNNAKPGESFFDFSGTLQMQLKGRTVKPAA